MKRSNEMLKGPKAQKIKTVMLKDQSLTRTELRISFVLIGIKRELLLESSRPIIFFPVCSLSNLSSIFCLYLTNYEISQTGFFFHAVEYETVCIKKTNNHHKPVFNTVFNFYNEKVFII